MIGAYRDVIRRELTPERVAAWRPNHPHADLVDFVVDHDAWGLLPPPNEHEAILACRYLALLRAACGWSSRCCH